MSPQRCIYRVYTRVGEIPEVYTSVTDLALAHGPVVELTPDNGPLRPELRRQPTFPMLCGPMWDGVDSETGLPAARYESAEINDLLSR